jgi:benzoyl-CoA reductase/2-hydroxyglutaryl-CoA dehydratase subunit BcrC/BadD/HgdB
MTALEDLQRAYRERDAAARAWKAKGGKIVAYLDDTVPEELIEAAGFMAYRISGDPDQPTDTLKKYLFPFWKKHSLSSRQVKFVASNSMLDLIYRQRYDFVDYLVIAYSRKNLLAFWHQLTDAKSHYPDLQLPELYILDRAITPHFESGLYNRERILEFRTQLEAWSGKPITDAAMAGAIAARNENKALLAKVQALRSAVPPKVSGVEALAIFGASQFLPVAEHNRLLKAALPELEARPGRAGKRVFVGGSALDHTQLYGLIEGCGATVVSEDHNWGMRTIEHPTATDIDPIEAIADRYHKKPPGVLYPVSKAVSECARRATEAKADAAVFSVYAHDDHQIWDIPDELAAVRAAKIDAIYLEEQPYKITDTETVKASVSRLLESL